MEISVFFEHFFSSLNSQSIRYSILRNFDDISGDYQSRDVDILIEASSLAMAIAAIESIGVEIVYSYKRHNSTMLFLWGIERKSGAKSLEIDFIFDFTFRGVRYFDPKIILDNARIDKSKTLEVKIPLPDHVTSVMILGTLLCYRHVPTKYRDEVFESFSKNYRSIIPIISVQLGERACSLIVNAVKEQIPRISIITQWRIIFEIACSQQAGWSRTMRNFWSQIVSDNLLPLAFPRIVEVAFLGPDGAGKSTAIGRVANSIRGLSVDQSIVHLRKKIWFSKSRIESRGIVTQPHALRPRGKITSLLKVIAWVIGERTHAMISRPRHPTIIIYDRSFDDLLADPRRYRLKLPESVVRFFRSLMIKPAVTFVLVADAEIIMSRKQEVSRYELEEMLVRYENIANSGEKYILIDASSSIDEVVARINRAITDLLKSPTQ